MTVPQLGLGRPHRSLVGGICAAYSSFVGKSHATFPGNQLLLRVGQRTMTPSAVGVAETLAGHGRADPLTAVAGQPHDLLPAIALVGIVEGGPSGT